MDGLKARMGLMLQDIRAAVRERYEAWGVEISEEDIERVVAVSGHVRIVVRDEYERRKDEEKRMALVYELHQLTGKSERTILRMCGK